MSLPHFFLESQVLSQETDNTFELQVSPDDAKHAKVLRLQPGEHIAVVDASSDYFECEVVAFGPGQFEVAIAQRLDAPKRPKVILVQGLAKGDKMDTIVRHATEVGISSFIPLVCERSVVKLDAKKAAARQQRWKTIAKSASMQSGRPNMPQVSLPLCVAEAASAVQDATAVLVCWEEASLGSTIRKALDKALGSQGVSPADAQVAVVIGPEGGLAENEVRAFLAGCRNAQAVSLGSSILRTETAGIVAPALVLYELEARS